MDKTNAHHEIAGSHFSARTRRALTKAKISIAGCFFAPEAGGDYTRGETVYTVTVAGAHMIRTFGEVLAMAAA